MVSPCMPTILHSFYCYYCSIQGLKIDWASNCYEEDTRIILKFYGKVPFKQKIKKQMG
jgi:hypothetical protein